LIPKWKADKQSMVWPQLSKTGAMESFDQLFPDENTVCPQFQDPLSRFDSQSSQTLHRLRLSLVKALDDAENADKKGFAMDCMLSIALYCNTIEMNIPMRVAASMSFWYWISLKLIPDLVFRRFSDMNRKNLRMHYFHDSRRVWPYVLWWGAHLTWQGDVEKTKQMLSCGFNVSAIEAFIYRGGSGFRVDLFRMIAAYFAEINKTYIASDKEVLRKVMVLNTSKTVTIEPVYYSGGMYKYVQDLFAPFITNLKPRNS
jgi:hypothetical protein